MNPGDRLGPYEIVSRIGAGGMGEVWRARDRRLERSVAIKILPRELAGNAELRIRFEREAKTISQLNHPHICTLHDFGHENGIDFLVMELLEGDSLADRISRGPMPTADVLRYGAQIAEALHRAHRAGVVHRDLKPGNIVITRSGAKLLDFGLAKPMASSRMTFDNGDGDTERIHLTEKGIVMGTFQYMAPEQIAGELADSRTDIFSFGTVLYEMTTGRRPFDGGSRTSLIAAIITAEPRPASQLTPGTPPALEHLIAKCLSKDPEDRWQSAHDIAEELKWIASAGSQAVSPGIMRTRRGTWERIAWILVVTMLAAIAGWLAMRPRVRGDAIEAVIPTDGNGGLQYGSGPPAFSPDGKSIAYAAVDAGGQRVLWLRSIAGGAAKPLAGTYEAAAPFWSADGRFLAFVGNGRLKKIAVSGGDAELIVTGTSTASGWNRDDVVLYAAAAPNGAIYRVAASGGEPAIVIAPSAIGASSLDWPTFLPDGKHFLFLASGAHAGAWVASLDPKEKPRFVTRASSNIQYVEPGFLVFASEGLLRVQRFDAKAQRVEGEPVTIAPVQSYGKNALFAASPSLLVYQPPGSTQMSELVLKTRAGGVVRTIGGAAFYFAARVSPDGHRIAVDRSDDKGVGDIWLVGSSDGAASRFSFEARNETAPVWSPRGDEIAYRIDLAAGSAIQRKRIGEGPRTVVEERRGGLVPTEWSPDGRYLAVARPGSTANADLAAWAFDRNQWIDVSSTSANETNGTFSADSRWIAYQSDESGRYEIYVQPFPPTGAKYQLSTSGGTAPRWLRSGEIVFIDAQNRLESIRVTTTPAFQAAAPEPLFAIELRDHFTRQYDVLPDGTFLVNVPVKNQPKPMTLLVNWDRRL